MVKTRVQRRLGFVRGNFPTLYLGVPIFQGVPRARHLRRVVDKILSRFTAWEAPALSLAGRVCLINYVISSSTIHSMCIYKWPRLLIKELEAASRNFLWTGKISMWSHTSVSWARVCALKEEGGLGLISFIDLNTCLLRKFAWGIITDGGMAMLCRLDHDLLYSEVFDKKFRH